MADSKKPVGEKSKEVKAKAPVQKVSAPKEVKGGHLAVVRIRGEVNLNEPVDRTLKMLNLYRRNTCVVVPSSPSVIGMINKVDLAVTWGEIDDATRKELESKRGEFEMVDGKKALKPFFRLHPPRKGFERKGTKKSFSAGGALGYRGAKINDLIKRML